jgi:predicted RNase H-like HicB family nuclease
MSATARPPAEPPLDPARLTIDYSDNEDGWVTAQIVEFPGAISQGPSRHEAWVNVLDALHDLTHQPTLAERLASALQALIVEPLADVIEDIAGSSVWGEVRERARSQLERVQRERIF